MIPVYDDVRRRTFPFITIGLILANTLVFLYELSLGPGLDAFVTRWALEPAVLLHDPLTGAVCNTEEVWAMCDEMFAALAPWLPQFRRR